MYDRWFAGFMLMGMHFPPPFFFRNRNEAVRSSVARLVWSLLRDPSVLRHKSCKLVAGLLASVSYRSPPTSERGGEVDHGKFLGRYMRIWLEDRFVNVRGGPLRKAVDRHCCAKFEFTMPSVGTLVVLFFATRATV